MQFLLNIENKPLFLIENFWDICSYSKALPVICKWPLLLKPGPWKIKPKKNLESENRGIWKSWTLKNLDFEKTRPWNADANKLDAEKRLEDHK